MLSACASDSDGAMGILSLTPPPPPGTHTHTHTFAPLRDPGRLAAGPARPAPSAGARSSPHGRSGAGRPTQRPRPRDAPGARRLQAGAPHRSHRRRGHPPNPGPARARGAAPARGPRISSSFSASRSRATSDRLAMRQTGRAPRPARPDSARRRAASPQRPARAGGLLPARQAPRPARWHNGPPTPSGTPPGGGPGGPRSASAGPPGATAPLHAQRVAQGLEALALPGASAAPPRPDSAPRPASAPWPRPRPPTRLPVPIAARGCPGAKRARSDPAPQPPRPWPLGGPTRVPPPAAGAGSRPTVWGRSG